MKKFFTDNLKKKWISVTTAFVIAVNAVPFVSLTLSDPVEVTAVSSAENASSVTFGPAILDYNKKLVDNGDGTFTFSMEIGATYSLDDLNINADISRNGYYTVKADGDYLVQLWGGDGGTGERVSKKDGGKGGKGGYVYGVLSLKAGDRLYYALGGDGDTETDNEDGGGVNGDGGGHGDSGNYNVGGGGGYSVLFKLNDSQSEYTEEVRKSSALLMVAGGGGGGGSGNKSAIQTPDGGDGGNIDTSISGTFNNGIISGKFYAGYDGRSSGKVNSYIGRGGADVPGISPNTSGGKYEGTESNDWFCTYHSDIEGGSGGSGQLRGGAGGAGFAGGSGGVMEALLKAYDIGGGGGGSSFVADSVKKVSEEHREYMISPENDSETGGKFIIKKLPNEEDVDQYLKTLTVSGSVGYFFDVTEFNVFQDGEISQTNQRECKAREENISINGEEQNVEYTDFSFEGELAPNISAISSRKIGFEMILKPKKDFHGGNNVPLFDLRNGGLGCMTKASDGSVKACKIPMGTAPEYDSAKGIYVENDDVENKTSFVNVPLSMNLWTTYITGMKYDGVCFKNMHNYDMSCGEPWTYLETIDISEGKFTYELYYVNGDTKTLCDHNDSTVHNFDAGLHKFEIRSQVTPLERGIAEVGTVAVANLFVDYSYINVIEPPTYDLAGDPDKKDDDLKLQMWKKLSFDQENNKYDVDTGFEVMKYVEVYGEETRMMNEDVVPDLASPNPRYSETGTYTAPRDGWYFVELWGGSGGKGGDSWWIGWGTKYAYGGAGGTGGYVNGYIYLKKGAILDYMLGFGGRNGKNDNSKKRESGEAGTCSYIKLNSGGESCYLMIAGGGGGGNAAEHDHAKGEKDVRYCSGSNAGEEYETSLLLDLFGECDYTMYNGKDGMYGGETGHPSWDNNKLAVEGTKGKYDSSTPAGLAGKNYLNTSLCKTSLTDEELKYQSNDNIKNLTSDNISKSGLTDPEKNAQDGAIRITMLPSKLVGDLTEVLKSEAETPHIVFNQEYSKYFDIITTETQNTINSDTGIINAEKTMDIAYTTVEEVTENNITYAKASTGVQNISVSLKPKSGFLGGNDVPFLKSISLDVNGNTTVYNAGYGFDGMEKKTGTEQALVGDYTDSVNVALVDDSKVSITPNDITYTYGSAPFESSTLYIDVKNPVNDCTESWQYDFVEFISPQITIADEPQPDTVTFTPSETTKYNVSIALRPKITASEAKVIAPVQPVTQTVTATAYVNYNIHYQLTGVIAYTEEEIFETGQSDIYAKENSEQYKAVLKPIQGYLIPEKITVYCNDSEITGYTYSNVTGELTIPNASIAGNIKVQATAPYETFKVLYIYEDYDESLGTVLKKERIFDEDRALKPGDKLTDRTGSITTGSYTGYIYQWDWGVYDDEGNILTPGDQDIFMGGQDYWVVGSYVPQIYTLTIKYLDESGQEKSQTVVNQVEYGQSYSVASPRLSGYIADKIVVSGVMQAQNTEITVTYTPTANKFSVVSVVYGLDDELDENQNRPYKIAETVAHTQTVDTDADYSYEIIKKPGYSYEVEGATLTDDDKITGKMPADGIVVYIYYKPEKIKLTFDSNNGLCNVKECMVYFGDIYGYNDSALSGTFAYNGLPTAICPGQIFQGWEIDGTVVSETSVVSLSSGCTLKAKWGSVPTYSVTVNYFYAMNVTATDENNNPLAGTVAYEQTIRTDLRSNMSYIIDSPKIEGYLPDIDKVKGIIDSSDVTVNVYYSQLQTGSEPGEGTEDDTPVTPPVYTITLKVYDYRLEDKVTDSTGEILPGLSGGAYKIEKKGNDGSWTVVNNSVKSPDSGGTVTWTSLEVPLGELRIVSEYAPSGYKFMEPIIIRFENENQNHNAFLKFSEELPFAGGMADILFYAIGLTVMSVSVVLWFLPGTSTADKRKNIKNDK